MLEFQIFQKLDEMEKLYEEIYVKKVDKLQRKFDDWYMTVVHNIARISQLETAIEELKKIFSGYPIKFEGE